MIPKKTLRPKKPEAPIVVLKAKVENENLDLSEFLTSLLTEEQKQALQEQAEKYLNMDYSVVALDVIEKALKIVDLKIQHTEGVFSVIVKLPKDVYLKNNGSVKLRSEILKIARTYNPKIVCSLSLSDDIWSNSVNLSNVDNYEDILGESF